MIEPQRKTRTRKEDKQIVQGIIILFTIALIMVFLIIEGFFN